VSAVDHWESLARHSPLGLLVDLDGTLIPFADRPEDARPGSAHLALLRDLARAPGVSIAICSGRPRDVLEGMLAEIPGLWLVAEHGAWLRGDGAWRSTVQAGLGGLDALAAAFDQIAGQYRRASVERKTWSVCLHYRGVRPRERMGLVVQASAAFDAFTAGQPGYERLESAYGLEVRPAAIRKSIAIPWMREKLGTGARLIALGDDLTDEDMFRAVGPGDEPVHVGPDVLRETAARWRLPGPPATVALLRWILAARAEERTPPPEILPSPVLPRASRVTSPSSSHRLLAISNRLPELRPQEDHADAGGDARKRRVGGLVSALEPVLAARGGLWLGSSGRAAGGDEPGPPAVDDGTSPPLAWIDLPSSWNDRYYNGLCNRGLWPLLHSFTARARFVDAEWEAYQAVNEAFAAAAAALVDPDATVWVHDFHMLLVAGALRRRGHRGPIGLFVHVPFPGPDVLSIMPWADRLVGELLEFDLVGLHTPGDAENLRRCAGALSPARVGDDVIEHRGRRTRVDAFPIGIMPEGFQEPPEPGMAEEIAALLSAIAPSRLVLGVDRLDYTKGIPERWPRSAASSRSSPGGAARSRWSRSPCPRAPTCPTTPSSARASRRRWAASTASSARRAGCPSATSTDPTRATSSRSSTAPRTSATSRRCATA
jgi:trehalose 6-phosphate synthase